jgi:hypothetical protein
MVMKPAMLVIITHVNEPNLQVKGDYNQVWWCMPVIPAGRGKKIESSRPAWDDTVRPCLKQQNHIADFSFMENI